MKKVFILTTIVIVLFFFPIAIIGKRATYIMYLKLFNLSAVVPELNNNGDFNGEVVEIVNGNVKYLQNYSNGFLEGESFKYFGDGQLKTKAFFKKGKLEGKMRVYDENGRLKYNLNYKNGKQHGDACSYFENKELQTYGAFDITGKRFFTIRYDKLGNINAFEGFTVSDNLYSISKESDSVIVINNDIYQSNKYTSIKDLYITASSPPDLFNAVKVTINGIVHQNLKIEDNTIKISNAFPSNGTYEILIESQLLDKKGIEINGINIKTKIISENYL